MNDAQYSIRLSCGAIIDGAQVKPLAAFINHSGEPNVKFVEDDQSNIFVVVIKPIPPGAQLLVDYGLTFKVQPNSHVSLNQHVDDERTIFTVVLTGGPCAGKSACIKFLLTELTALGYNVLTVP